MDQFEAIQACKKGDYKAQKVLFSQYAQQMYRLCYRYVRNHEDAEELMLNGFLSFFKSIKKFRYRGKDSVAPWLKKIMINECLMFLRKKKKLKLIELNDKTEPVINEDIIAKIEAEDLYGMITDLPVGYRTVFNLFVIEGMTHKEIAKILKISEGTSKSQLSKARKMLQSLISKRESATKSQYNDGQ